MATRYEKVVLDIESRLAQVMARDAAAAALLNRELNNLDGSSTRTSKSVGSLDKPISQSAVQSARASKEIDRFSGRLRLLVDTAAILGPAFVPIGAVAIPAVTGLAAQLGAAALAGGTAIVAFQGVGDALKAVNKAALEPTTDNLEAARLAMGRIGPEAQEFVSKIRDMVPALQQVRNAAAAGLFPGLTRSLDDLQTVLPQVEDIVYRVGDALGDLADDAAISLAGPEWADFLGFLETEIPAALSDLGHIVGNLAGGMAELWMAFTPLNNDFASWLLDASEAFEQWSQGLSETQGFQEFVDYIRENGPKVADALGSIGSAVLDIVEAAAPLGGPVLEALSAVADVVGAIADSDAGPSIMATVTALALLSRGMRTFEAVSKTSWATSISGADGFAGKMQAAQTPLRRGAAALGGIAVAATGAADGIGLTNTASGVLLGTLGGPWGAAVGGALGLALDFAQGQRDSAIDVAGLTATLNQQTGAITENTRVWAAKQLEESGLLADAQTMGLSLSTVTDAALGQADAVEEVTAALDALIDAGYAADQSKPGYAAAVETGAAAQELKDKLIGTRGALDEAQGGLRRVAAASGGTRDGFHQVTSAAEEFRNEIARVNAVLDKRASLRDYQAALDDFADTLDDVKDKAKLLTKDGKINIDLPKGREVQAALDNIAQTALKVAENLKGMDRQKYLTQARKDFLEAADDLGLTRRAAKFLATELGLLDRTKAEPTITVDTANADRALRGVKAGMDDLHDKTVTITVHTQRTGGVGVDFASGGQSTPRTITPRATTTSTGSDLIGSTYASRRAVPTSATAIPKIDPYGLPTTQVAQAAQAASRALGGLTGASLDHLRQLRRELTERQHLLERELAQAEKKWQAERDYLKDIRDARRSLAQETSNNFMGDLFGEGSSTASLFSSLSASGSSAIEFQDLLGMLRAMGLDGPLFAQLAASGNLAAAQDLVQQAMGDPNLINVLEASYDVTAQAAQSVGQYAGNQQYGQMQAEQLKESREARKEFREANQHLKNVEHRVHQVEKAIEKASRNEIAAMGSTVGAGARRR